MFNMLDSFLVHQLPPHTFLTGIYTHKQKQPIPVLRKHKLLSFSVLMALSQRNDHFCGCKGTHFS